MIFLRLEPYLMTLLMLRFSLLAYRNQQHLGSLAKALVIELLGQFSLQH